MTLTKDSKYFAKIPPIEVLNLLITYGGEVDFMERYKIKYSREKFRTPLVVACKSGNFEFVKALVKAGADLNVVDGKKKMPLNYTEKNESFKDITNFIK